MVFLVTAVIATACNENRAADGSRAEMQAMKQGPQANAATDMAASTGVAGAPSRVAAPPPPPAAEPRPGEEQLPSQPIAPSMVIRTGDARVKVSSGRHRDRAASELARRVGGYVRTAGQGGEKELRQATLGSRSGGPFPEAQAGLNRSARSST